MNVGGGLLLPWTHSLGKVGVRELRRIRISPAFLSERVSASMQKTGDGSCLQAMRGGVAAEVRDRVGGGSTLPSKWVDCTPSVLVPSTPSAAVSPLW